MEQPDCSNGSQTPRRPRAESAADHNDDLIGIINLLQNKLAAGGYNLDISLPQIVVVGCQSAGKSSVLENIVGREFLPRGSGVVTRRPTVIQLEKSEEEFATFLHKPKEKFIDFQRVRDEIHSETQRDPGPEGFSSVPICLKIFSPNVLKLTLVDLPGLIRVTVENQSEDSIEEVRKMVLQYITQPNSLILAVSPANQDIANSDALEIAKTVDPKSVRTIGVLTKLDLMDEGTDVRDVLENKKIPLKRGYIAVLNRSQRDIAEERDFNYCLAKERKFFQSKPCYSHMADKMGTPYLIKYLHKQLHAHIKESLPGVRQELTRKLATFNKMLKEYETQFGYNSNSTLNMKFYMIKLIQKFIEKLHVEIFGCSEEVRTDGLSAGARISHKLYSSMQKGIKLPEIPEEEKLLIIEANLYGTRTGVALPQLAFETVINLLSSKFSDPLNCLIDDIVNTLLSSVEQSSEMMSSYPTLKNEVLYSTCKYIHEAAFQTKESLDKHIKAEMCFVNSYHPDFTFPEFNCSEEFFPLKLWKTSSEREDNCAVTSSSCSDREHCERSEALNNPLGSLSPSASSEGLGPDRSEALNNLCASPSAKQNARFLVKVIERYLVILPNYIGNTAIKYILYFLVKAVMKFIKSDLMPVILETVDEELLLKDCEKDFNKMIEIKEMSNYLKEALNAVQTF